MIRLISLAFAFCCSLLLVAAPANADTFTGMMNKIVQSTPGITNVAITGGVRVGATGAVDVAAGGLVIPVATTVAADVGVAAIALGAAKVALRVVPWVGAAVTVAEIAKEVNGSGVVACPPPDFFCKPSPSSVTTPVYVGGWGTSDFPGPFDTGSAVCVAYKLKYPALFATIPGNSTAYVDKGFMLLTATTGQCVRDNTVAATGAIFQGQSNVVYLPGIRTTVTATCPAGFNMNAAGSCVAGSPILVPIPQFDLQSQLNANYAANNALALAMKQNLDSIAQQNVGLANPVDTSTAPVTVTAPQVVTPAKVVSTTTIPNADGSTSTQTVSATTTVTPAVSASPTVSTASVSYPSVTTTTTTTTNNTTNVSNQTTTTTYNNPPASTPAAAPAATEFPTDYNREATQKLILQQLDGTQVPDAPVDQSTRKAAEMDPTDKSLADKFTSIPTSFVSDKTNWFSWVWTPPVGVCSAVDYSGSVHGYAVSFDICPWVSKIRDGIGFIFAIIGALSIYTNIFKKGD